MAKPMMRSIGRVDDRLGALPQAARVGQIGQLENCSMKFSMSCQIALPMSLSVSNCCRRPGADAVEDAVAVERVGDERCRRESAGSRRAGCCRRCARPARW